MTGTQEHIPCLECGVAFRTLPNHLHTHDLTTAEYRRRHPGAPIITDQLRQQISQAAKRNPRVWGNQSAAAKRMWANPEMRKRILANRRRYYENHPELRKQISDTKKRMWANPKMRKRFSLSQRRSWKGDTARLAALSRRSKLAMTKRHSELLELRRILGDRPADWNEKPPDKQMIATLLFQNPGIQNTQLGKLLDAVRLLACPYGDSWERALRSPGRAANFISEIRKWVNRPGRTAAKKSASIT
jgi:hypothetical protein